MLPPLSSHSPPSRARKKPWRYLKDLKAGNVKAADKVGGRAAVGLERAVNSRHDPFEEALVDRLGERLARIIGLMAGRGGRARARFQKNIFFFGGGVSSVGAPMGALAHSRIRFVGSYLLGGHGRRDPVAAGLDARLQQALLEVGTLDAHHVREAVRDCKRKEPWPPHVPTNPRPSHERLGHLRLDATTHVGAT